MKINNQQKPFLLIIIAILCYLFFLNFPYYSVLMKTHIYPTHYLSDIGRQFELGAMLESLTFTSIVAIYLYKD